MNLSEKGRMGAIKMRELTLIHWWAGGKGYDVDIPYIRGKKCSKPCVMKCKERRERVGSLQTWHDSCSFHICLHFT